jgi:hypothetical protein
MKSEQFFKMNKVGAPDMISRRAPVFSCNIRPGGYYFRYTDPLYMKHN